MRDSAPGPEWTSLIFDGVVLAGVLFGANAWFGWHLSWFALSGLMALVGAGLFFVRHRRARPPEAAGTRGISPVRWPQLPWARINPWVQPLIDGSLLGLAVWSAGRLTGRVWSPAVPLEAALAGAVAFGGSHLLPAARLPRMVRRLLAALASALLLGLIGRTWPQAFGWSGTFYAAGVAALAGALWQAAVSRSGGREAEVLGEHLRLLAIVAVVAVSFSPLLTPQLVGGLDARWYGYAVTDALGQARAGFFPVLMGQGEYMFNGAVHPFRTAPYHCYLAFLLDLATLRRLAPLAVEHLTLVATALQMGLISYFALAALSAGRRTAAALLALIFLTAPVLAAYVYGQEMYMTVMAFGFLPLVLYANLRLLERDNLPSFLLLAGALSAIWTCHAPVALWTTLVTAGLQGLRLLTWDWSPAAWRRSVWAGAVFLALSAYYFASISELDSTKTHGISLLLATGVVFAVGFAGLVRFVTAGSRAWLGVCLGAAGILFFADFIRGVWLGAAVVAAIALSLRPRPEGQGPRFGVLMATLLAGLAGIAIAAALGTARYPRFEMATFAEALATIRRNFPGSLLPISRTAVALSDLQLGWSCWLLLAVLLFAGWRTRARELQVAALVAGVLVPLTLPLPGITPALLPLIPQPIYAVGEILLWLRFTPVFCALAVFAGGLALLRLFPAARDGRALVVLAVLLAWNLVELRKFVARGEAAVALPQATAAYLRSENARLYSYDYNNFPLPAYVVNGVVDHHLENRLLRPEDQAVLPDPIWRRPPRLVAALTGSADKADPRWLHLSPKLTLAPGERLALEFQFEKKDYRGSLVFRGNRGFYRDYLLPSSGEGGKSFGSEPGRPNVLAIWNTTAQSEEVELLYLRDVVEPAGETPETFATITVRAYRPENLQVNVTGLVPYRAEVTTDRPVLLETPRVFIPGYRAWVNGAEVAVQRSAEKLATIPLPAGHSVVELVNRGSGRLKLALGISLAAWLALAIAGLRRRAG